MKFTGEYRIDAPRETVWAAINNPDILRQCIVGCEEIIQNTPTDWTAKVTTRVGPVKARFAGNIRLEDLDPPARCRIVGEGSGGAAGFASGGAVVELVDADGATILTYEADAQIGGKLAQIGSRLIEGFAKRYADDFFASFARIVAEGEVSASLSRTDDGQPAGVVQPLDPAPVLTGEDAGASAILAMEQTMPPPSASTPQHSMPPAYPQQPGWRFDGQSFTIVVLALLLVFMTIMVVIK